MKKTNAVCKLLAKLIILHNYPHPREGLSHLSQHWRMFGSLWHIQKLKLRHWNEEASSLWSCWVIALQAGSAAHWGEQTSIHSLSLPGSRFPWRPAPLKHSRTPWQEAATGTFPPAQRVPAYGFPSTWKKWLIPVRTFGGNTDGTVQERVTFWGGGEQERRNNLCPTKEASWNQVDALKATVSEDSGNIFSIAESWDELFPHAPADGWSGRPAEHHKVWQAATWSCGYLKTWRLQRIPIFLFAFKPVFLVAEIKRYWVFLFFDEFMSQSQQLFRSLYMVQHRGCVSWHTHEQMCFCRPQQIS